MTRVSGLPQYEVPVIMVGNNLKLQVTISMKDYLTETAKGVQYKTQTYFSLIAPITLVSLTFMLRQWKLH